jgi:hypothetical protein
MKQVNVRTFRMMHVLTIRAGIIPARNRIFRTHPLTAFINHIGTISNRPGDSIAVPPNIAWFSPGTNIFVTLGMVVNTGSEFSLTLSKAALVLSSLPVHINNRYNWCDSAFSSTHVSKGVVVNTCIKYHA